MRRLFFSWFLLLLIAFTSACSNEQKDPIVFEGYGSTDLFEAVAIDGMNIQISWGHKDEENKDTIHIGGSMNPQVADTEVYP